MKTLVIDELLDFVDRSADEATERDAMKMLWFLHDAVTELACACDEARFQPEYPGEQARNLLDTLAKPEQPLHRLEAFRELVRMLGCAETDMKNMTEAGDLRAINIVKAQQVRILRNGQRLAVEWMDGLAEDDGEAEKRLWKALIDVRMTDLNIALENYALRKTEERILESEEQQKKIRELAEDVLSPTELAKMLDHLAAEREVTEAEMKKAKDFLWGQPIFSGAEALYECKATEARVTKMTVDAAAGQKEKIRELELPISEEA